MGLWMKGLNIILNPQKIKFFQITETDTADILAKIEVHLTEKKGI